MKERLLVSPEEERRMKTNPRSYSSTGKAEVEAPPPAMELYDVGTVRCQTTFSGLERLFVNAGTLCKKGGIGT